jgi:hypothetical protein
MTEGDWVDDQRGLAPIVYRDFHDVPRLMVVFLGRRRMLFDCVFDDRADDYFDRYEVYRLPDDFVPPDGSWESLISRTTERLGSIAVRDVKFDSTKRGFITRESIERFAGQSGRTA